MSTVVQRRIGPADHGRPMTEEEFRAGKATSGYKYEIIDGRLYVSPAADLPQDRIEDWLYDKVKLYAREHLEIINYVTNKARIFVPGRRRLTVPEPDLAAYRDFPLNQPFRAVRWQDVSPLLVGEILSASDPDKDLVRNVALYIQVPTIREYWILDPRDDPERPTLTVYRRRGPRWQRPITIPFGETYTTRLLPGFALLIDPRQ